VSSRRSQLLETVLAEGILRGTESQPIFRVDGTTSRWMLDTLAFSLSARGSKLAARALLERLRTFEGRQLATFGTTGIPLMQAVIAESKGRYSGLIVRKDVKAHGARRRVQGPRGKGPVVILDDSLSSGFSIRECRRHLEDSGFEVEGALVLVRFGYDGVGSLLTEDGLRAEAIFDTDKDLRPLMEGEELPPLNPGKVFPKFTWSRTRAAERQHPAILARAAIASFLQTGSVPRPPRALDATYDGRGGVFVSLRRRSDIHERPARAGFWHFPEESQGTVPEEFLKACVLTADTLAFNVESPLDVLSDCAIAVTFFSRLEPCTLGALDNDSYGIVVRSRERRGVMGGALPRMPGIRDGWHQFRHAAWKNAQVYACEPIELLRHKLTKVIEPGESWQPTGVPRSAASSDWEQNARPLTELARQWVLFHLGVGPRPAPSTLPLDGLAQLFVSPYIDGAVVGCTGDRITPQTDVNALFDRLAEGAVQDQRFEQRRPESAQMVTVGLSLLRHDLDLGSHEATTVMTPTRFADQVLEVRSGDQTGILLPYVAVTHDLSPQDYADAVVTKAAAADADAPLHWTRYDCSSWVAGAKSVVRLVDGLPERAAEDGSPAQLGRHWAQFLANHSTAQGAPVNRYLPFSDEQLTGVASARLAHSAWVKARIGLKEEAAADLAHLTASNGWLSLEDEEPSAATLSFAALALQQLGKKKELARVTATLRTLVGSRVKTAPDGDGEQDYAPGQVLYALAQTVGRSVQAGDALAHYRRRFRVKPEWGSVAWLTMAFAAWSRVCRDGALLDFAWEIADWALLSQAPHGGFWNDQQPDSPGATTAVYLEGFSALLPELKRDKRKGPAARLERAIGKGFSFLSRLTYLPKDAGILPNPAFAVGGVRMSLTSGEVRLDFVQHALSAALLLP
jgi:orotate phosphoribosyltransferase/AMMECR1 domain-containing protein